MKPLTKVTRFRNQRQAPWLGILLGIAVLQLSGCASSRVVRGLGIGLRARGLGPRGGQYPALTPQPGGRNAGQRQPSHG